MTRRMGRVNELIRDEVSRVVQMELRDPRISPILSVTGVKTSTDLMHARVYVSVMAAPAERLETVRALQSAAGFIRRTVGGRLRLRRVPDLQFELDTSIEEGEEVLRVIRVIRSLEREVHGQEVQEG